MMRIALAVAIVLFASVAASHADDYGPRRGVREVRAAVPILVHRALLHLALGNAVGIDDAVVGNDHAIVDFHGPKGRGIAVLSYKNATWWLIGADFEEAREDWSWWIAETPDKSPCANVRDVPPDAAFLRSSLDADPATVALWSAHVRPPFSGLRPVPRRDSVRNPSDQPEGCRPNLGIYRIDGTSDTPITGTASIPGDSGYRASWTSSDPFAIANVRGRAPTDAEMSGPGANSIYYLYANGGATSLVAPKSTLSIWCPFVLDPEVHYIIEFSGADGPLGPIRATLNDNTLTFEIPAFSAPPGADLRGEVDYLPYRPR